MFHVRSLEKAIQKIKRKIEVANNDISLSEKARNRKIKRYKENLSELQYKKIFLAIFMMEFLYWKILHKHTRIKEYIME